MFKQRGFTLIELLVVIAIIGTLSAIVLAGLNSARSGGNVARIKQQLNVVRTSAQNYAALNNGSFASGTSCTNGMFTNSASGLSVAVSLSSFPSVVTTINCESNSANFAVSVNLPTAGTFLCVDATQQIEKTSLSGNNVTCNY